jgi:hypothetical protein
MMQLRSRGRHSRNFKLLATTDVYVPIERAVPVRIEAPRWEWYRTDEARCRSIRLKLTSTE